MSVSKLGFVFQLQLTFSEPVKEHSFVLRILPAENHRQHLISSALHIFPDCRVLSGTDHFGSCLSGTVREAHAGFSVQTEGTVALNPDAPEKSVSAWQLGPYRRFTTLTAPGPHLTSLANHLPASDIPAAVMKLLSDRFTYLTGSTHAATTAEEAAVEMKGVCQDETHIMLSLLRIKGIPCRYVMGYLQGDGSTHAWVDVLQGDEWIGLDPTNQKYVSDEYISIAAGRDANDCPVNRGIFIGNGSQRSNSSVSVWRINQ